MPVVTVQGMPSACKPHLPGLKRQIKKCIAGVRELGLEPEHVSVFFSLDLLDEDLGEELVVTVRPFIGKDFPARTHDVLMRIAIRLRDLLEKFAQQHLKSCAVIEFFVEPFDFDKIGFAYLIRASPS